MSPGDRCDEIIRLIDETLRDLLRPQPVPATAPRQVATLERRSVRRLRSQV